MAKTTDSLACRIALCLTFGVCLGITAISNGGEKDESPKGVGRETAELERLVEALANRSPQPKIVSREEFKDLFIEAYVPLFDKDYDWREQDRVHKATVAVAANPSPELWDRLVAHENNTRYWLTLGDGWGAAPGSLGSAHNWSIGDYCGELAYQQAMFPVDRNLDILEQERPVNDKGMRDPPVDLPTSFPGDLLQWRKLHPGTTLVELQMEICQRAIEDLPKLKDISEKAKAEFRARMESEIEQLKKSKTGIFGRARVRVFSGERFNYFDAAKAKEIREKYEQVKKRGNITQTAELERLVEALVNRNSVPKIEGVKDEDPIFDEKYDWKEQDRVLHAIKTVAKQTTPEMWEVLVKHDDDKRYCLTYAEGYNGFTKNDRVGDFCGRIAYDHLMFPVDRSLDRINRERTGLFSWKPLHLSCGTEGDFKKWREAHAGKAFFELQVEVCERAIEEVPGLKDVSVEAKADCIARLKAEIEKLRSTKTGIFGEFKFPCEYYSMYNEKRAAEIRRKMTGVPAPVQQDATTTTKRKDSEELPEGDPFRAP